jgi:hypothetical protein
MIWETSTLTLGVFGVVGVVPTGKLFRTTALSSACHTTSM